MAGGLVVVLLAVGSLGLPHDDLEEGDSPCLHRPCQHGVCEEDPGMQYGYRYLGHSISGTTMSKGYFRDTVSCTGAFVRTGTLGTIVKPTGTNAGTSLVSTEEPAWMESLTTIAPAWRDSPAIDARQTWTTAFPIPACTMEPA